MLKQRIITAIILAVIVSSAVFKLPVDYFSLLMAIIVLIAAWEWTNLIGMEGLSKRILFLIALILPMIWLHLWTQFLELSAHFIELGQQAIYQNAKKANLTGISTFMEGFDIPDVRKYSGILDWLAIFPVLFWIFIMVLIRNSAEGLLKLNLKMNRKAFIGWFILLASWMFFIRLRAFYGPEMTMYFLVLIWLADIAAFFAGKKYGKTKLAPEISPGKTVQGMYGALLAALICGILISLYYRYPFVVASDFVLLSVLTVLVSIYGDLFFSLAKRIRGVKDSGTLLPGHGGLLDRMDSVIAAAPFFYAGVILITWQFL